MYDVKLCDAIGGNSRYKALKVLLIVDVGNSSKLAVLVYDMRSCLYIWSGTASLVDERISITYHMIA